jgi:DNA-3-methyladenine glycosylase
LCEAKTKKSKRPQTLAQKIPRELQRVGLADALVTRLFKRSFFNQNTLQVASALLGQCLDVRLSRCRSVRRLVFTEVEAYLGQGDEACHAHKGLTPRTRIMFGPAGYAYIYLIYGMYCCLNVVTEPEGTAGAVLIRGAVDLETGIHVNGPGKLCRDLGLSREHNGMDMVRGSVLTLRQVVSERAPSKRIHVGPRIGISKARDLPYRFWMDPKDL